MSKAASLGSSVVIKKGQAAPVSGAQGRAGSAHTETVAVDLRPLSFKVLPEFDERFRRFAFERRMKLNELLYAAFDAFEAESKQLSK